MLSFVAMGYFEKSPLLIFPLIALLLFLGVFVAVTVRALRSSPSKYDAISRLPLEADSHEVRHG
jgi:hypothetical protein